MTFPETFSSKALPNRLAIPPPCFTSTSDSGSISAKIVARMYPSPSRSIVPECGIIAQAVATLGPRPELIDTRAMAYLSHNMNEQAVADLEREGYGEYRKLFETTDDGSAS